jgi:hypothetical protein
MVIRLLCHHSFSIVVFSSLLPSNFMPILIRMAVLNISFVDQVLQPGHWRHAIPHPLLAEAECLRQNCGDSRLTLQVDTPGQEVTKRCRPSWLTNSALVYEPKCGGRGDEGSQPMSTAVNRNPNKRRRSNSIFNLCSRWEHSVRRRKKQPLL